LRSVEFFLFSLQRVRERAPSDLQFLREQASCLNSARRPRDAIDVLRPAVRSQLEAAAAAARAHVPVPPVDLNSVNVMWELMLSERGKECVAGSCLV
jgi:hypothetical protein